MTPEELDRCKRRIAAYCHIAQMLVGELADAQSEIDTAEAAEVAVTADEILGRLHEAVDLVREHWFPDDYERVVLEQLEGWGKEQG